MAPNIRMSGPTLKVLKLMLEKPQEGVSGTQISKSSKIGSGTLYPLLQRLELANWVNSEWETVEPKEAGRPRRRFYKLTRQGHQWAMDELAEFQTGVLGVPVWT